MFNRCCLTLHIFDSVCISLHTRFFHYEIIQFLDSIVLIFYEYIQHFAIFATQLIGTMEPQAKKPRLEASQLALKEREETKKVLFVRFKNGETDKVIKEVEGDKTVSFTYFQTYIYVCISIDNCSFFEQRKPMLKYFLKKILINFGSMKHSSLCWPRKC